MSAGGYWDKRGNQYEDRWALKQVVLMTAPTSDISSLEREPSGKDERGVDLWVNRSTGIRECHQCKLGKATKGSWSPADLKGEKVFDHMRFQLDQHPSHRYRLVSGSPAPVLQRLCREARDSRDSETFWLAQVLPFKRLRTSAQTICEAFGLSPSTDEDRQRVWFLLRKSDFALFRNDDDDFRMTADLLGSRLEGDPRTALGALESWLREQYRRPIDLDAVAAHLQSVGLRLILGDTDRLPLLLRSLHEKRHQQGRLLQFEADVAALQVQARNRNVDRAQILAGRWRLTRRIKRGGFAETWLGEDSNPASGNPVRVVKVLRADRHSDSLYLHRFYDGARRAKSITDPRIARVLEQASHVDGRHFYIMEHVEGVDLEVWLRRQRLPAPDTGVGVELGETGFGQAAQRLFLLVGEALSALHNVGLVHGDVKPANILVTHQGIVKVCDFDLLHSELEDATSTTALGSLPFAAPEVQSGRDGTALSDQYSLAVVALAFMIGAEIFSHHPGAPFRELLRSLPCSIAVQQNLSRALASDPQLRFETIEAFMANLGPDIFGPRSP